MGKPRTRSHSGKPPVDLAKQTVAKYRAEGLDVGPIGKPDPDKLRAIYLEKRAVEQQRRDDKAGVIQWDERLKKAKALREEMEYDKARGLLVDVEDVKKAAFKLGREIRDGLLNIPDRVAPILTAETDLAKVHALLSQELRQALEAITQGTT